MAQGLLTSNWEIDNFVDTTLSADMTDSTLEAFLTTVPPTADEGTLVIDPDSPSKREIIYYTSKTALKVNISASGRGYDQTTATSHTAGTRVIMAPIADWFNSMRNLFTTTPAGWTSAGYTPNTVTCNGNRSYDLVFNSVNLTGVISPGMRLRTTRTVAAPTQSTSLNGTTQYYSKSSPAGMTFTDDFTVSAWVKPSSYPSSDTVIMSRSDGSNGWILAITSSGQIYLSGYNAGAGNYSRVTSYQSLPLNKWTHIALELDMSAFTATSTTSYIMFDGIDVPSAVARAGTNPTALVQAGTFEVGAFNGANGFFAGKIAQAAVFSAKVTQATMRGYMSQGLAGTETSLISAYSFDNSITDKNTTNANNLTANGSAVATNADSPFGAQADGTISSTLDYAIVQKTAYSTNTTVTVQVPEGGTIPTSGGVSAVVYSSNKAPYGMPTQRAKWILETWYRSSITSTPFGATNSWLLGPATSSLAVPIGSWRVGYVGEFHHASNSAGTQSAFIALIEGTPPTGAQVWYTVDLASRLYAAGVSSTNLINHLTNEKLTDLSAVTTYALYGGIDVSTGGSQTWAIRGDQNPVRVFAENAYL